MTSLAARMRPGPLAATRAPVTRRLAGLASAAARIGAVSVEAALSGKSPVGRTLKAICAGSPYLWELCEADPLRLDRLLTAAPEASFDRIIATGIAACAATTDRADAMRALRAMKAEAALLIALCDLGLVWDLAAVTGALTRLADTAVDAAIRFLLLEAARAGRFIPAGDDPLQECGFVVLAMGKHGAFELNYSSDIDLIALYDPETTRLAAHVEPGPFFVRLTQGLVKLLGERTSDGYVFRVDLRLRPDPGSTAVAIALPAAYAYYETAGQNWERAAMIKARASGGDIPLGEGFLAEIGPFIWRRHLDYAAIADVHAMKRQIQIHKGHATIAVAGHDLKLGRGGIREIEFFVQTQQLIAGGRNLVLQGRGTVAMLAALAAEGWIGPHARDELTSAYRVLRGLEHRVQMVADEQTHALPAEDEALARFAAFAGFRDRAALEMAVTATLLTVQRHYAGLFEAAPELTSKAGSLVFTGKSDDPETLETLSRLGYAAPAAAAEVVRGWHFGRYVAMRSAKAREDLTALTPALLEALARVGNPDETLQAFDRLLAHMPTGFQFFAILRANAGLLQVLARILGVAPRLAQIVASRPHALDGLLDPAIASLSTEVAIVGQRLLSTLELARDYEDQLDRARVFAREQTFQIGARIVAGELPAFAAGEHFATLAEALIRAMLQCVIMELERAHGRVPGGRVALLGMGKLGGREMAATSDLDLIVIYDHDPEAVASDGERPLAPATFYARLTQRLISALSAPTAEGMLYSVDMRLRPSGRKGPVAIHIEAFRDYQQTEAWTWEHMALTRARVVGGDSAFARTIAGLIRTILGRQRDADLIRKDAREMRALLASEKGDRNRWDLKLVAGGLVDIEFIAQVLQLLHGASHPALFETHTGKALDAARREGVLSVADHEMLSVAFRLYTETMQVLRLCLDEPFDPTTGSAALKALVASCTGSPDFRRLEADLHERQEAVRAIFTRVLA